jgi:hypothetical protein
MEILVLILVGIFLYIFGFKRGYEFREKEARQKISDTLDSLEEDFISSLIRVRVEKVNNYLFVYNDKTNEFMAQGKTEEELSEILKQRYPGKRFAASENNLKEVGLPHE